MNVLKHIKKMGRYSSLLLGVISFTLFVLALSTSCDDDDIEIEEELEAPILTVEKLTKQFSERGKFTFSDIISKV